MRLWWVELRRLFGRRSTRLALLLLIGLVAAMVVSAGYGSRKTSETDLARAEQAAAQERSDQRARCETAHAGGAATPQRDRSAAPTPTVPASASASAAPRVSATPRTAATPSTSATPRTTATPSTSASAGARALATPTPASTATGSGTAPVGSLEPPLPGEFDGVDCATITYPTATDVMDHRTFSFRDEMPARAAFLAALLALVGYLVGASYVGAEWQHGTMAGLLLWEPRRVKVYVAKLFALFAGLIAVGVTTYAVGFAAHWAVADLLGDAGGVSRGLQGSLGLVVVRGIALALAIATCGFAIAYAVRLSAAALGAAIAYIVGAEIGLRVLTQESQRWLLTENITAWLNRGTKIYLSDCDSAGRCTEKILDLTMWQGGAYVGGLALVLAVVAAIVFARRDVT